MVRLLEPLTAHFDHRSQFWCQENAYIKAKPVLAVAGSPCDYRLARNDFHNCGFAASAGSSRCLQPKKPRVDSNVSKTYINALIWGWFLLALPHYPILTRPIPKKLSLLGPPTITADLLRRICSRFTNCLSSNKSRQLVTLSTWPVTMSRQSTWFVPFI